MPRFARGTLATFCARRALCLPPMPTLPPLPPARDLALFLDVDGTLIEFAATPGEVRIPPNLAPALSAAQNATGALALLSGRSIAELDRLVAPLRLCASGLHGAEIRTDLARAPTRASALPPGIAPALAALLRPFPGTALENKGASVAIHYRAAPASALELRRVLERYIGSGEGTTLELMAGELVYEIKPFGFDKGSALRDFMAHEPFRGRQPVFVSDHPIDQAGFDAATSAGGFALSVGRSLPGTTGWFADPAAVRAWLMNLQ